MNKILKVKTLTERTIEVIKMERNVSMADPMVTVTFWDQTADGEIIIDVVDDDAIGMYIGGEYVLKLTPVSNKAPTSSPAAGTPIEASPSTSPQNPPK